MDDLTYDFVLLVALRSRKDMLHFENVEREREISQRSAKTQRHRRRKNQAHSFEIGMEIIEILLQRGYGFCSVYYDQSPSTVRSKKFNSRPNSSFKFLP